MLVGAGELLVRKPGIIGLHAVTTTNALRYAFDTSTNDDTRRMLLLQNAAFLSMFLDALGGKDKVPLVKLDELQAASIEAPGPKAVDEIFADVSADKMRAAAKVLRYVETNPAPTELVDAARLLIFMKGRDAHDYKFSSAVFEDYHNVSPAWRGRYLASSVFHLRGAGEKDNKLVERTRSALA